MKKSKCTENNFEVTHVTKTLVDNGYIERLSDDYNSCRNFISEVVTGKVRILEKHSYSLIIAIGRAIK